ncbi:hypothetical protein HMPREF0765_1213 [Sphingobacterium spiritivorum ATCC 33300]|uniref:DUF2071 domain-containing protein n=1 Tax=Sphingobacterium spiritivorum ATCC 33300 TaxID=525372 RepID=C2FV57_SPHSI|nr:DUF2071 domain-containing protein [Sphingobacterium spiritivorum]EEI93180.1 hypothetical protein HMPREF0765_1213 [Sphingobacterium spiritivorum ATCC 33300]QQS96092.1 DUF2071 domain-containing protein [Sphingobacterium spiritivorum]
MEFLKNHPFAVEAFFDSSVVLTFALPKQQLQKFIPDCLELDLFEDNWAFIAVALVQTSSLRPKGFPSFMGHDFFLIGYRIFVRYSNADGKKYRGLYILKSETDKKKMEYMGNIFTHYNYSTTDILQVNTDDFSSVSSKKSGFEIQIVRSKEDVQIPEGSVFSDWKDARKFAGPLPFTFTYNATNKKVLIIEGVRQNWKPSPIQIQAYRFDFFKHLNLDSPILSSAFEIKNVPYYWKKGRTETWQ